MTFWLYQPNQLFKSSSILPHKSKDAGDLLNFLTIFLLSFSAYMKNKINNEVWKKMLIGGLLAIVVMSLFFSGKDDTDTIEGLEVPKYNDYKFSLSVD
tara:strand:- start:2367 stop:2660 length:294 start_codon:yes stop_codon:yes gene_type:complete